MNLFENLKKIITKENNISELKKITVTNDEMSQDEIELAQKLDAIEIFTVDRIEDDIVVLENRRTQEIVNISISELPNEIKTGDILKMVNGKYFIDEEETKSVEKRIEDKMNDLWN
ncbi:MAG: DUF3006 domain-containing protein [Clostridia bacterium]|nr:DUF3006 domain-containing protein [Clostridia bacterium]